MMRVHWLIKSRHLAQLNPLPSRLSAGLPQSHLGFVLIQKFQERSVEFAVGTFAVVSNAGRNSASSDFLYCAQSLKRRCFQIQSSIGDSFSPIVTGG